MNLSFTTPPPAPQSTSPSTFDALADAFVAWFTTHTGELNTQLPLFMAAMNMLAAGTAFAMALKMDSATADGDPAAGYFRFDNFAAQTSATRITSSPTDSGGTSWATALDATVVGTSATIGQVKIMKVADPSKFIYAQVTAFVTHSGHRDWTISNVVGSSAAPFVNGDDVVLHFTKTGDKGVTGAASGMNYEERATYATMLVVGDGGKRIKYTGTGNASLSFDTYSNLGNGWRAYIENGTTGYLQVTADGATYKMYPGEIREFYADVPNTRISSNVKKSFTLVDTAAGTFLAPPGYYAWDYLGVSSGTGAPSGGSGASGNSNSAAVDASGGSGASAGRYGLAVQRLIPVSMLPAGTSVAYAPGAASNGGAAVTGGAGTTNLSGNNGSTGNAGNDGNTTTFGTSTDPYYSTTGAPTKPGAGNTGIGQAGQRNGSAAAASADGGNSLIAAALVTPAGYISTGNAIGGNSAASTVATTAGGTPGTVGASSNQSPFNNATAVVGGTPGAGSAVFGTNAGNGVAPAQAPAGAGGAGGSGGGGSKAAAAGTSGNGGNSGAGGQSGPGFVRLNGRF